MNGLVDDAALRVLRKLGESSLTCGQLRRLFGILCPQVSLEDFRLLLQCAGQSTEEWTTVDVPDLCGFLFDTSLAHQSRAVSVAHLCQSLLPAVEAAGLSRESKVYEIEPAVIRPKGLRVRCLRDNRMGAAYVDSIFGAANAGPASFMLSYTWGYQIGDISETLSEFCSSRGLQLVTYVWICCLCINQHRVKEAQSAGAVVAFEDFERAFGERVSSIGHVIAMMSPWDEPLYISRVWCDFEMFTAIHVAQSQVTVVMPPREAQGLRKELTHGRGIGAVWNTLSSLDVECAQASVSRDRDLILQLIQHGPGFHQLNMVIGEHLKDWILRSCEGHLLQSLEQGDYDSAEAAGNLCNEVGSLLSVMGCLGRAEHVLKQGIRLQEEAGALDSPGGAELQSSLGEVYEKQGDLETASELYERAWAAFQSSDSASRAPPSAAVLLRRRGRLRGLRGDAAGKLRLYAEAREALAAAEALETSEGAMLLSSLGAAKRQEGDLEAALEAYEAALKIHETLRTLETPEGATLLSNIGVARLRQRKKKKATEAFNRALKIREKTGTLETSAGATLLTNIADVKALLNDTEAELQLYLQAKDIRQRIGTLNSSAGAVLLSHLAGIFAKRGETSTALEWLQRSREAREQSGTLDTDAGAKLLAKTGELLSLGSWAEACAVWEEALRIRRATETLTCDAGVKLLSLLAGGRAQLGDSQGALEALRSLGAVPCTAVARPGSWRSKFAKRRGTGT
ncbi:unnamed protein product [Effrenium voratum]|uniref:Uncharacterized protein n=1 Tax=Effrenium voratum TaxID=2562239 RepID=A0AA36JER6_9DINO|nr:unnamed protein product [Effrenium voratum]